MRSPVAGGDLGGGHRDRGGQVLPRHLGAPRARARSCSSALEGRGIPGEDPAAHAAGGADVARDGAGVDAADADDAVADERVVERLVGAPVGDDARGVAHDVARHPDAAGLGVFVVHAGVADVRRGLQHDLAGVRGIGEGLLVAGHAGREDHLAEGRAARAVGAPDVAGAVLEHEDGGVGRGTGSVMRRVPVGVGVRMPPIASATARAEASCGSEVGVDDGAGVGAPRDADEPVAFDDAVDRDGRLADVDDAARSGGRSGADRSGRGRRRRSVTVRSARERKPRPRMREPLERLVVPGRRDVERFVASRARSRAVGRLADRRRAGRRRGGCAATTPTRAAASSTTATAIITASAPSRVMRAPPVSSSSSAVGDGGDAAVQRPAHLARAARARGRASSRCVRAGRSSRRCGSVPGRRA